MTDAFKFADSLAMAAAQGRWWRLVLLVLLAACGRRACGGVPATPCPHLFYYADDARTGQVVGVLLVPPPQDSTRIVINLKLTVPVYFNTKYAGRIKMEEDKNTAIVRLQQGNRHPIRYSVHFPIQRPLPELTKLEVNGEILCSQSPDTRGAYTTLSLMHTLVSPVPLIFGGTDAPLTLSPTHQVFPSEAAQPQFMSPPLIVEPSSSSAPQNFNQQNSFATPQFEFENPDILNPTHIRQQPKREPECGRVLAFNELLVGGDIAKRGSWPWLSAMFLKTETGLEFQCGGTLITKDHVLTAAHCVRQQSRLVKPEGILIYLGKYNLLDWTEQDVQPKDVARIVVHPQYGYGKAPTGNDIAVLFLSTPANFGLFVQPACLYDPRQIYEDNGNVVGWGRDENGNRVSTKPKVAILPIVSQEECLRSKKEFYELTSNRTLCAGARNGVGPCNGDSGSGMYSVPSGSDKWFVRGIVSLSLQDQKTHACDLSNYIVFTDLSKFLEWIYQVTHLQ